LRRTKLQLAEHKIELQKLKNKKALKLGKKLNSSLGEKIIAFDNAPKNDVRTFNKIFGEIQGGNQDDELIIGDLFTCNGRYLYRNGKEIRYLFNFISVYGNEVYDVYDKESGEFIWTHTTLESVTECYQVSKGTVNSLLKGIDCKVPIKVRKLCLYRPKAV
jgi:outer membrane protein assembly factor BamB